MVSCDYLRKEKASMIRILGVAALLLGLAVATALAATTSLSIVFSSPPSTAVSCPINYPSGQTSFTVPQAPGTVIATCSVTPSAWQGALTLSGANAAAFTLSGMNVVVGAAAITAPATDAVTVTSTP
jgi:hypothetical protein